MAFKNRRYEEAVTYFEEALEISRKSDSLLVIAQSLSNISLVYITLHHVKAFTYWDNALKIIRTLGFRDIKLMEKNWGSLLKIMREIVDPETLAKGLASIGEIYRSLDMYKEAIPYLEEALKIGRKRCP